jgi:hypothetical protein
VRSFYERITSIAHLCEGVGTPVRLVADLFSLRIATRKVRQFEDIPILSLSAVPEAEIQLMLKRGMDLAVSGLFLIGYGAFRFLGEFARNPDDGIFGYMTFGVSMGQWLSLPMIVIGIWLMRRAHLRPAQ